MTRLDVSNVGQGDSMILTLDEGCDYKSEEILVDLGPGGVDIIYELAPNKDVRIFVTHHDQDHLGGLKFFYYKN